MRTIRLARAAAFAATLAFFAPQGARAADDVVNFDAAPAVVGQFADQVYLANPGVTFASPIPHPPGGQIRNGNSCSTYVTALATQASKPNVALLGCGGSVEFPDPPSLFITFKGKTRTRASIRVGNLAGAGHQMQLSAYDERGKLIDRSGTVTTTAAGVVLSVAAGQPEIFYLLLDDVGATTPSSRVWVDDLTFDTPAVPGKPAFDVERSNRGTVHLVQGGPSKPVDVTVSRLNGSSGKVKLDVIGLPRGVAYTQAPSVNGFALTVTPDPLAAITTGGDIEAVVRATPVDATAGAIAHDFKLPIRVAPPITMYASDASVSLPQCEGAVDLHYGIAAHAGPAKWEITGLPPGVTASIGGIDHATAPAVSGSGTGQLRFHQAAALNAEAAITVKLVGRSTYSSVEGRGFQYGASAGTRLRPAQATSASPTSGHTPVGLAGATTITVRGDDLCTGANGGVRFGNDKAIVKVGASSRVISVPLPTTATSGVVQVIPDLAKPAVSFESTYVAVDSYRNTVGFAFPNYKPNLTVDQMTAAFSYDQTHYSPNVCSSFTFGLISCKIKTPLPDPWAMTVLAIANATMGGSSGGACFGFSRTSQQYRRGLRSLKGLGNDSAANAFELDLRGGAAGGIQEQINANQLSQLSTEYLNEYAKQAVGNTFSQTTSTLRREIEDKFRAGDFPLLSLRDGGSFSKLHVVVGYAIEDDGAGGFYLSVYDSNYPFGQLGGKKGNDFDELNPNGAQHEFALQQSRIHVWASGKWSLPSSNMGAAGLGNIVVTGFGSPPEKRPTLIGASDAAKAGLTILLGWSASGLLQDVDTPAPAPPSHVTQVVSGNRKLFSAPGVVNTDPATALRAVPWAPANGGAALAEGLLLAAGPGASYSVETTGDKAGDQVRTVVGDGMVAQVTTEAKPGVTDRLAVTPAENEVGFTPGGSAPSPVEVSMMVRSGDGSTRSAQATTTVAARGSDAISFDGSESGIRIEHRGPPAVVTLTLSSTSKDALPVAVEANVPIGRNAVTTVKPDSWKRLVGGTLIVKSGGKTRRLRTSDKGGAGARTTSLKLSGGTKGTDRVAEAAVNVPQTVAEGDATMTFGLRRGKKIVATQSVAAGGVGNRTLRWTLPAKARKGDRVFAVTSTIVRDGSVFSSSTSTRSRKVR